MKLYPAGATTNSQDGVTDLFGKCAPVLEEMIEQNMPLLVFFLIDSEGTFCFCVLYSQSWFCGLIIVLANSTQLSLIYQSTFVGHYKTCFTGIFFTGCEGTICMLYGQY